MSSKTQETPIQNEETGIKDELTISETRIESECFVNQQEHYQFLNINQDNDEPCIIFSEDEESDMPSSILPDLHPPDNVKAAQVNPNKINQINSNVSSVKCVVQVNQNKINPTNSNKSGVECVYQYIPMDTSIKIVELRTSLSSNELTDPLTTSELYKCGLCNLKFEKAVDRNNHIVSHSIAPTYKCKCCQKDFPYFTAVLNHLKCNNCYKHFPVHCFHCKHSLTTLDSLHLHHQLEMKECQWCRLKICGREIYEAHLPICHFRRINLRKKNANRSN